MVSTLKWCKHGNQLFTNGQTAFAIKTTFICIFSPRCDIAWTNTPLNNDHMYEKQLAAPDTNHLPAFLLFCVHRQSALLHEETSTTMHGGNLIYKGCRND